MKTISSLFDVDSEDIIIEPGYEIGNSYVEKIDYNEIWMDSKGEHFITEDDVPKYVLLKRLVGPRSKFIFKNFLHIQPHSYKTMDFEGVTFECEQDVMIIACGKIKNLNISKYWKSSYAEFQIYNVSDNLELINTNINCNGMMIEPAKLPEHDSKSKIFIGDMIRFVEPSQYLKSLIDETSKLKTTWDPVPKDLLNKIFKEINYNPNDKNIRFQRFRLGKYNSRLGLVNKKGNWYKA